MTDLNTTRREAVADLLATINDKEGNNRSSSHTDLAQRAVDAMALHALNVAQHHYAGVLQPETSSDGT